MATIFRRMRQNYRISLQAVAEKAGISMQHLSRLEMGEVPASHHHEAMVYKALCQYMEEQRKRLGTLETQLYQSYGLLFSKEEDERHEQ